MDREIDGVVRTLEPAVRRLGHVRLICRSITRLLWGEYILVFLYFRERLSTAHDFRLVSYTFAIVAAMLGILAIIEYVTLPDFTVLEGVIRLRYGAYSELLVTILPALTALGIVQDGARDA